MALREKYTKFLDSSFRRTFLLSNTKLLENPQLKLKQYARYVVDSQILNRSKEHENDKEFGYGFSPINFLCAIHKDGKMSKTLFEFNIVNHFLKEKEGEKAVEVVEVMLVDLVKNDKTISTFDIDIIDAELKKIEEEYLKAQAEEDKKNQEKRNKELEDEHRDDRAAD